ncbi:MAG TPA: double-strand break repair protein AddB [Caulobacterales bacterium]|nr:double-strand break repair protein AddB [Caulobacterales bacterium]
MSADELGLFEGPAPRLRAIPASAPFLDVLADAMVSALVRDDDPFALSDAIVLLPNRRASRGLVDAFAKRLRGAALLPAIKPLGDLDDDPDVWGAEPIALDVPPAIEATRQRLELAALIRARDAASGGVADPARAIALSDELKRLLDSAAAADEVRWDRLGNLVEESELATHWQQSAQFLQIITDYWPQRLKADGLADPGARRSALLLALAREWERKPPTRPIIIAGSTGSVAATRALMRVAARLPRGAVVFPGLDIDLDDDAWDAIGDQHPQFALKETLRALNVDRRDVPSLGEEDEAGRTRRVLLREALAPAEKTADWLARLDAAGGAVFVAAGAEGVRLLEAATEDEEATAIALLLREVLESESKTAALSTPDVGLARRVEAKLRRWGVNPVVSHGRPLRETRAGLFIALLCELAGDPAESVALAALLKHPLTTLGLGAETLARARTALEHEILRGARRCAELDELEAFAKSPPAKDLARRVREAFAPLIALAREEQTTLARFADAISETAEAVADAKVLWRGPDGEGVAGLLTEAIAHGGELGALSPYEAQRALTTLMRGRETPPAQGGDPRVAIWGPLEARLQRRDLMILGGLNEGVWPAPPSEDPFMSRQMRARLGLPSLDARIGLAAHDFAQLASAPEIVLTRSLKRESAPSIASRWLWRLETLVRGAGVELKSADAPVAWAQALDAPSDTRKPRIPRPKPPANARLKRISVTQVETLIRDPYAVYARRLLGLEALKPIGAPPNHAERGTAVHAAIERFADGADPARLLEVLDEELRKAGFPAERRVAERSRVATSVAMLLEWLDERRARGAQVYAEKDGALALACGVTLSGKADRIEIAPQEAAILDFKTGAPPSDPQVASGLSPQLPLEAAMLARGAFKDVPKAKASELVYWRFGGADPGARVIDLDMSAHEAGEKALAELEKLLRRYAERDQPFLSKPRVQFLKPYADYDLLARRKEWADAEGDE